MPVSDERELVRLVREGWVPYYHSRIKRWYLRKGRERIIIDRKLDDIAEELAREVKKERERREREKEKKVREALRTRALGGTLRQALSESGMSKSSYYRTPILKEYEILESEGEPSALVKSESKPSTPAKVEPKPFDELLKKISEPETSRSQRVFNITIPVEEERDLVRGMFSMMEDDFLRLLPPLPFFGGPPKFFKRRCQVKCPNCGGVLTVEVPSMLPSDKEVLCENCMALLRLHFKRA